MGMILTDNLKAGMTLAVDVHDRNGRMLLGAGTELTDKHIYVFHTWGVIEADIAGVDEADNTRTLADPTDPEVWAAAEAEVRPLFCHTDLSHPVMNQLLNLGILRRVRYETS
jgi:hypothetical protein